MWILVTGGAGFIGSHFIRHCLSKTDWNVINYDKLTYAGDVTFLSDLQESPRYVFVQGDVGDRLQLRKVFSQFNPVAIVHFAAETHVDRSIVAPETFIETNVDGTFHLLEETLSYWQPLKDSLKSKFRFLHISTDEVYGSLKKEDPSSTEISPYAPNSPYAASKAASDHLVRAYGSTFGIPFLVTHATNNFGPRQFPEKLLPLIIYDALKGLPLPIYGDGQHIRNWLYVEDHCIALEAVLKKGQAGESYNIASGDEMTNIALVSLVCDLLDEALPNSPSIPHRKLISFVTDRPGHDRRYGLNTTKIQSELGWKPSGHLREHLAETIHWYIENQSWAEQVLRKLRG